MGIQPTSQHAAIVTPEGDTAIKASAWGSLQNFHSAPCLRQSIGTGLLGGLGLGGLRFATHRNLSTAVTWGAVVGGLLAGTYWFVCRRSMYSAAFEEAALLQRVMAQDPDALREYQAKLLQRQRFEEEKVTSK